MTEAGSEELCRPLTNIRCDTTPSPELSCTFVSADVIRQFRGSDPDGRVDGLQAASCQTLEDDFICLQDMASLSVGLELTFVLTQHV